ncbi:S8 family serine peptidase [Geobacter sp. FeAm09]|uniref:S8 family serine peptidase n=1 Tax=Geobacter sp. FeAm09 TaxID=2597769 RepID=UPI0011F034C7|nr:S8 family serine peptidase [Geobacter sp. FeAm09]QEM67389.1 S8 family serine peptidase [Geobacter sp. FeAm09]
MERVRNGAGLICALCVGGLLLTGTAWADEGRVIVKYRSESDIQALGSDAARMRTMSAQTGLDVVASRVMSGRMHAVRAAGVTSRELAARLAARADVEYAVPDERRFIAAVANDPMYSQQWYLQAAETSAINATAAWDTTTGSSSVVVAVLDTGILPNHPDLTTKLTYNGSTLYGYDFVSDTAIANDGDGRDSDPSDPGDWVTAADLASSSVFDGCTATNSSWHGSMVAGIIAAQSNNSLGVAGVSWGAKILPVRVMGKCGGYDSDIIDGMRWAAGLSVTGVPINSYPARIINMSLGGSGSCTAAYQDAVSQVRAAGAIVVAAAGNDGGSVGVPANCTGVLAVAALRNVGSKVGYSNYGPEVGIAAPGGNCGTSTVCQYPFYSTKNSGTTSPETDNYSVASDNEIGTSFSSPLAAGVAALMRSVNSSLPPSTLISRLKSGASGFPTLSGVTSCAAVDPASVSLGKSPAAECNCTTATCGAGMLNAAGAVSEALRPIAAISSSTTATITGGSVTLSSTGTVAADGRTIASHLWTTTGGTLANADQATATLTAGSAGTTTVSLAVTDDAGKTDTASTTITVTAAVPGAPSIGTATAGDARAMVAFTPPTSNGSPAIDLYKVTSSPGGVTATGTSSPIIISGLTNGTTYTFTVAAHNNSGYGAASAASNSATPTPATFTAADALLALKMTVGYVIPTQSQILKLDVAPLLNGVSVGDGTVDMEDAVVILRKAVGLM